MSTNNRNTAGRGRRPPQNSLLVRVPEEVWTHIFNFVGNDDLANLTLTCATFSKYLQKRKSTFLFQQVFPFIHDYQILSKSNFISNLMNYRLTCKSWKVGVDTYLETFPRPTSEPDVKLLVRTQQDPRKQGWGCAFGKKFSVSTMRTFQEIMGTRSNENPFPGRSLQLNIGPDDNRDNLYGRITNVFMKQFGVHLWHVYITDENIDGDFLQNRCTPAIFYLRLRELLTSMPNLRSFMFAIEGIDAGEIKHTEDLLAFFALEFPLPVMPYLEQLDASMGFHDDPAEDDDEKNVTRLCRMIQDLLMSTYSLQLKVLHIHWNLWKPEYCAREALRNLRDLHLEYIYSNQNLQTLATKCGAVDGLVSLPELFALQMDLNFVDVNPDILISFIKILWRGCPKLRMIVFKVADDTVTQKVVKEFFTPKRNNNDVAVLKGLECSIKEWSEELPQMLL